MIDKGTIDRIFDAAQIVDVVQDFVSLKRKGANYWGLCPFHNEKTPSFSVSPTHNIYKCFGCGEGGNAVNFLIKSQHMTYVEALRYLAKKYHIEIKETEETAEEQKQRSERESLSILTQYAQRTFQSNLFNTEEGRTIGLSYFKERGYREDIIKSFGLGYALRGRDAFYRQARTDGYKDEFLLKTGLCIQGENSIFDRFFDRVMFPVYDISGKVIAFSGRVLKSDSKAAKYQNSPESEIYQKRRHLFGLFQAKKAILKEDLCYLAEGNFDVLGMHQAGIENTVASLGTSLTVEQVNLIKRFTNNVTMVYDGDAAGVHGAMRGIDMFLEQGMNVKVVLLPEGEDPDSFVKHNSSSEVLDYIQRNQSDFITFKTRFLAEAASGDPFKRAEMVTDVVRSISIIPDGIVRAVCIKNCSRMMDMDEKTLVTEVGKRRRKYLDELYKRNEFEKSIPSQDESSELYPDPEASSRIDVKDTDLAEREVIRLMVAYGSLTIPFDEENTTVAEYFIKEIDEDELSWRNPIYGQIYNEVRDGVRNHSIPDSNHFAMHPDPVISRTAADLLFSPHKLSALWKKNEIYSKTEENQLGSLVPHSLYELKSAKVLEMLKDITRSISLTDDPDKEQELLHQCNALNEVKKELAKTLGCRVVL